MNSTLSDFVEYSWSIQLIYKNDLTAGDAIILETINSVYLIKVLENRQYSVSRGWFEKNNLSSMKMTINGCSFGASIIKTDIVAGCGLKLEFGNGVITSRINKIFHISNTINN